MGKDISNTFTKKMKRIILLQHKYLIRNNFPDFEFFLGI